MIFALIGFEIVAAMMFYTLRHIWLPSFIVTNAVLIPLLGGRMIEIGPLQSNVGNVFFSFVLLGFSLMLIQGQRQLAFDTLVRLFSLSVFIYFVLFFVQALPVVEGNDSVVASQAQLYSFGPRGMVGSLAGLLVSLSFFIFLLDKWNGYNKILAYIVLVPAAQAIDSIVFFPIAFGNYPVSEVLRMTADGFLIKTGIGWGTLPLFYWFMKHPRNSNKYIGL